MIYLVVEKQKRADSSTIEAIRFASSVESDAEAFARRIAFRRRLEKYRPVGYTIARWGNNACSLDVLKVPEGRGIETLIAPVCRR